MSLDVTGAEAVVARKRSGSLAGRAVLAACLVLAAFLVWQWMRASSPATVVDEAARAIRAGDWKTVYHLVDWSDDQKKMLDEGRFVALAGVYSKVVTLEDYRVGKPRVDGETALVPVTVTARVASLLDTRTKTDSGDVRCLRIGGVWRIAPDVHNALVGLGNLGIGGL